MLEGLDPGAPGRGFGRLTQMNLNVKKWMGLFLLGLTGFYLILAWGKYDFCAGWSDHYEENAIRLRAEASSSQLSIEDKYEHIVAAEFHEVVASKYRTAAYRPWPFGSCPKAPLVSLLKQIEIMERLAEESKLPQDVADNWILEALKSI